MLAYWVPYSSANTIRELQEFTENGIVYDFSNDDDNKRRHMAAVMAMDQGAVLHALPLHGADYNIHGEHDCIEQYTGHAHHFQPPGTHTADRFRQDGNLTQPSPASFAVPTAAHTANHAQEARFGAERWGIASDANSYQAATHLTDSSSGSISTSPSSAASSHLAYTTYPTNHYTGLPTYTGSVSLPQSFVPSSLTGARISEGLHGATSVLTPLPRPPIVGDVSERETYATGAARYLTHQQLPQPGFSAYPNISRSYGPALPDGFTYAQAMTSANGYGSSNESSQSSNFPWPDLQCLLEMTCEGMDVTPNIHAKVEKGLFLSTSDQKWTCYRRNYFSVACSYDITPNINNGRIFLKRNNNSEQVQAMGVKLSAVVDGSQGKSIELIQHTPKRDNGPKTKIEVTKLSPTPTSRSEQTLSPNGVYQVPMGTFHPTGVVPGPYLPLQSTTDSGATTTATAQAPTMPSYSTYASAASHLSIPGQQTSQTFERVQFKSATANNGKRRASQQYFHLVVELWADVRKEGSDNPSWVKVAQRFSGKIVVRGRSPSHYQNEGQNSSTGRGTGSSGGSSGYGSSTTGGYGMNAGGFRSSTTGYGGVSSGYRGTTYAAHPSSDGSSGSSPGSVDEGAIENEHHADTVMSDAERAGIQTFEGYQYFPGPIYEGVQLPPPPIKVDNVTRYTTEPRHYAVKAEYADAIPGAQWSVGACGRFDGVASSRGYYPDLSASFT
ncbi:hypothetical protein BAUCODRAFT_236110 [Baudoinia panamericana UAMH 10762]|uniref:NDT80 domain-containing protein n=1 Tax=Baudoinia panamericana (strain UAMH 10762) TaxID=717646 RepID=M2MA28_BAUPA|nr:uncharacterized protein BAUCODRAFT_236110 [Baudoinia panamericana UAMH 10762]EMC93326.1 hypothetical protein BAUCODRAFT_236110 [Baudoinia panamericana UAMH 10762]